MKKHTILKVLLSLILFLSLVNKGNSQNKEFEKVKNAKLTMVLNNLKSTYALQMSNALVRVYIIGNPSGSANQPESDEVTDNIYIAFTETDEHPRQSLFVFKNVYGASDVRISKGVKDMTAILSFYYINLKNDEKKKIEVEVTLDGVSAHK